MANANIKSEVPAWKPVVDEILDALSFKLADVLRLKALEAFLTAGKMITDDCYGGSLELFKERNTGDRSTARVAERLQRLGYPLSDRQLVRYVRMYEQELAIGPLAKWHNLTASHFWCVQPIDDFKEQAALLEEADAKALTKEQFVELLRSRNKIQTREKPSPSALDDVYRAMGSILNAVNRHEEWWVELRQAGLEDDIGIFDPIFEGVIIQLESAILTLADRGAHVPDADRNAMRKHIEDWSAKLKKASESASRKAAT